MDTRWGSLPPVSIRWDLLLILSVITVTCCSAFERCPYRSCRNCDIEFLTCDVKCCQASIYIYCCGDTQNGENKPQDERRINRSGPEPMALQNNLEMCVIRKPPPYVENPPPYCQTESNINIYGDTFEAVQLPGTAGEIDRSPSTSPPPYSEITGNLTAPRDTALQRY
ncbi:hypothetical protein ACJMK2_043820 [Sinanodonta woodiana]|uniref:Uncharacterized protein n=1 Tax=Sinanodonta woodiana TaxID=1069815 RepID=A0ABD3W189_SINWO